MRKFIRAYNRILGGGNWVFTSILTAAALCMVLFFGCELLKEPEFKSKEYQKANRFEITTRCIEGHQYYYICDAFGSHITIKLDSLGKPCPCK